MWDHGSKTASPVFSASDLDVTNTSIISIQITLHLMNTSGSGCSVQNITLTESELEALNHSFVDAGIKWIAMFKGIWAEVAEVKNGQVTILATFPTNNPITPDPDFIRNIFLNCKKCDFIDQIHKIFIIMYKDEGAAGGVLGQSPTQEEIELLRKASDRFGRNKVHIGERLYLSEELNPNNQ